MRKSLYSNSSISSLLKKIFHSDFRVKLNIKLVSKIFKSTSNITDKKYQNIKTETTKSYLRFI